MNTCKKMELFISRRIDNDLDSNELKELTNHIKKCPVCAAVEKKMNDNQKMVRDAKPLVQAIPDIDLEKVFISKDEYNHYQISQFPVLNLKYGIAALLIAGIGVVLFLNLLYTKANSDLELKLSTNILEQVDFEEAIEETVVEVNIPLAVLDYYMSIDKGSNILLQYSTINENPLSSYESSNETIGNNIFIRPIFSEDLLEEQNFEIIM